MEGRVLNACAGKTELPHDDEVIRNDKDESISADLHVDAAELSAHYPANHFNTIIFDPPWSVYQSNLRYEGRHVGREGVDIDLSELPVKIRGGRDKEQLGHARLAKEGFDYLLKPDGKVLELTFHGTCMPRRLGYERVERVIFDPVGEGKSVIGSVDQKQQTKLTDLNRVKNRV
jgi:hypothetical protein